MSANRISEFLVSHELQGYVNKHKLGKLGMLDEGVVIKFVSANIRSVHTIASYSSINYSVCGTDGFIKLDLMVIMIVQG